MISAILKALGLSEPLRWALVVAVCLGGWEWFKFRQQSIGAERATATIEKATDNAIALGKSAADKSGVGGVRNGKRDPSTRDD